jgi:hypothetical protein
MDDGQLGFFGPDEGPAGEEAPARSPTLPVDQVALNIVGIEQARIQLQEGRAANLQVQRRCGTCGSDIVTVEQKGQHLEARCAACGAFSYNVPRSEVGLATRPVSDTRRKIPASRRARILARDNGRCVLCGRAAADSIVLTIGHLVSVKDGERLDADDDLIWDDLNLAAMCDTCQLGLNDQSVPAAVYLALLMLRAARARRDGRWPVATPDPVDPVDTVD